MKNRSRGAVRLATALLAPQLVLAALPAIANPAYAEDGPQQARVLTDDQADELERRFTAAPASQGAAAPSETAEPAPAEQPQDSASPVTLTEASALETYQGHAETAQLGGGKGDFLAVHSRGLITRFAADGRAVWKRDNESLYADWQVKPWRPWQKEPYPARITVGYEANSPYADLADRGFAQGDLTGDGVADVVFTAEVGANPYRPFTSPDSSLSTGTFVTVLDGRTGATLWSRIFADAQQVALVGRTLLVADQPSTNFGADSASTTVLHGFRFAYADGRLTPAATWSYDTGRRNGRWASVTPLSGSAAALSWYVRKTDTAPATSRTLVIDTADGTPRWQTAGTMYGREAVHDPSRNRLVAIEQADYRDGVWYQLVGYDLDDGTRTVLDERVNALGTDLAVGELKGGGGTEYAVAEATLDDNLSINAATVRGLRGDGGTELWSSTVKRDESNVRDGDSVLGLRIADGKAIASYVTTADGGRAINSGGSRYGTITAFSGTDGSARWSHKGAVASPIYAQPYQSGDDWLVRTIDNDQNIHSYRLGNGKSAGLVPLLADLATGIAVDVNGDGRKDLVAGGQSRGLWAFDGPSLAAGKPRLLWRATLPGSVYGDIVLGDTDGDGRRDDVVVAAETAAVIVDATTGRVGATIDQPGQFVRSVTVADLNSDGADDVLVPADAVRAYRGDGRHLWSYAPQGAGPVVFSDLAVADGRVLGSYQTPYQREADTVGEMALDARTGTAAWTAGPVWTGSDPKIYGAQLFHGVYASPAIPYADGHAVVTTWIVRGDNGWWTEFFEFRDVRTGELVKSATGGGTFTLGNWFTGDEGLTLAGTASLQTFGKDGNDYLIYTLPTLHRAGFATGPGGRRLLVGGTEGAVYVWDPSVLTAGAHYPDHEARLQRYATQNLVIADLTGDGVDEVVGLHPEQLGQDRAAELSGYRYALGADNRIHGMVTGVLTTS
ncbi:VCBS repeat-containing protein [Streptomyces sp. NBC_01619]|uniref:VCBS repeat-containing protein n=1 Tax=Streptomyces sp. NBC_01619 TaxID=2975901 RepID=UPI00225B0418|nr:VCBS repeat-containing protein [Streptomyces sp. NBC_01619]MCX4514593.1 VCBS repeat-containing protein [Streptomyces sp. NBC_01619]